MPMIVAANIDQLDCSDPEPENTSSNNNPSPFVCHLVSIQQLQQKHQSQTIVKTCALKSTSRSPIPISRTRVFPFSGDPFLNRPINYGHAVLFSCDLAHFSQHDVDIHQHRVSLCKGLCLVPPVFNTRLPSYPPRFDVKQTYNLSRRDVLESTGYPHGTHKPVKGPAQIFMEAVEIGRCGCA